MKRKYVTKNNSNNNNMNLEVPDVAELGLTFEVSKSVSSLLNDEY